MAEKTSKLDRLAEILYTEIDWITAKRVEDVFPGFLNSFQRAEDEWKQNPENLRLFTEVRRA